MLFLTVIRGCLTKLVGLWQPFQSVNFCGHSGFGEAVAAVAVAIVVEA